MSSAENKLLFMHIYKHEYCIQPIYICLNRMFLNNVDNNLFQLFIHEYLFPLIYSNTTNGIDVLPRCTL